VLGIQKVECLDNYLDQLPEGLREEAIEFGTEFEAPIYAYRGKISSESVLGVIHPYRDDLTAVQNYGLSGGSAHLGTGPVLETKVLKVFFYEGSDGLTFYMIQNKGNGPSKNKSRILMTVKNNSTATSVILSDEDGELAILDSPSAKRLLDLPIDSTLFDGDFEYENETAGGIIGRFDDVTEVRDWEVILDPLDTGDVVMIKAADGKDESEVVLAQGPVKVNFDYSILREPVGNEDLEEDSFDSDSAYGNLIPVNTSGNWWLQFTGRSEQGGTGFPNPYSMFDGTYACSPNCREPDLGGGLSLNTINHVPDQNIRWWRDYVPGTLALIQDAGPDSWYMAPQYQDRIQIFSTAQAARDRFDDPTKPITVKNLQVMCSVFGTPATTFSITIVDDDGNYFVFPDRTVYKKSELNAYEWISFGAPTSNEVVVVESNPSTLESPPTGTIIGTTVTGEFKKTLDLRKVARVIVDIKNCEAPGTILGIQNISAILNDMPRFDSFDTRSVNEPDAYAVIEAFARYWRGSIPANGWPELPTNITGRYIDQWWPPGNQAAMDQTWHIIPGYEGEAIPCAAGAAVCGIPKIPLDEIRNNRIIFTTIPPTDGCQMFWKQVDWLERGHRIGAACSFYVVIDGMGFIVVKRSIGIDTTCGGGESADNPCVLTFLSEGLGHPAIAWPSVDGDEFIGKPNSGYTTFIKDDVLSERILEKARLGEVTNINGDPINNIPFIIFPSI
jgi:hypothetical protein